MNVDSLISKTISGWKAQQPDSDETAPDAQLGTPVSSIPDRPDDEDIASDESREAVDNTFEGRDVGFEEAHALEPADLPTSTNLPTKIDQLGYAPVADIAALVSENQGRNSNIDAEELLDQPQPKALEPEDTTAPKIQEPALTLADLLDAEFSTDYKPPESQPIETTPEAQDNPDPGFNLPPEPTTDTMPFFQPGDHRPSDPDALPEIPSVEWRSDDKDILNSEFMQKDLPASVSSVKSEKKGKKDPVINLNVTMGLDESVASQIADQLTPHLDRIQDQLRWHLEDTLSRRETQNAIMGFE